MHEPHSYKVHECPEMCKVHECPGMPGNARACAMPMCIAKGVFSPTVWPRLFTYIPWVRIHYEDILKLYQRGTWDIVNKNMVAIVEHN